MSILGKAAADRAEVRCSSKLAASTGPDIRLPGNGSALLGALALAVAVSEADLAEAATLPDGYVGLGSDMGVASTRVLADGSLELTLADGSVRIYAAGDFGLVPRLQTH